MRRLLKLWMICLIGLALPIQGATAASMLLCGPSHPRMGPSANAGQHHVGAVEVAPSDAEQSAFASEDAVKQSSAQFDKLSKAKCSVCSSCCTAAALESTELNFESAPAPDHFPTFAGSPPASFFSSAPERPPRCFLA